MKKHTRLLIVNLLLILFVKSDIFGQDTQKIDTLDVEKLRKLVVQIEENNAKTNEKIKALESSVTNQNIVAVLKKANVAKFKNDIGVLKDRFIAGEEILNHIIRETNSFNLSYQQLVLQSDFASLANPLNYPEFTSPLKSTLNSLKDKKPMPDIAQDLSNVSQAVPFLNNPIVSSGLSMASFFIAKYNDRKKFDDESFKKMSCVLNFTSTTDGDYKTNIQRILFLRDKIQKFNSGLKDFFALYLKSVNYKEGYEAYMRSRTSVGVDFLESHRRQTFNLILKDTVNIGSVALLTNKDDNIAYYIEQVKFHISEYESIIRDIESSINAYDEFYNKLNTTVNQSCSGIQSVAGPKLETVRTNITNVKAAFKVVNEENRIPANLKRTLFGL